jgi:hypothetical protein
MSAPSVWQGGLIRLRAVEPEDWQHFSDWEADEEGRLRRTVYTSGRYYDDVMLGLTLEEFEESLK